MRSKNSKSITKQESAYMAWVKSQSCVVCNQPGPSEAHHVVQGDHFTTVPLCQDCHTGSHNGIHRQKRMWMVTKMDEPSAINETIRRFASEFFK